MAKEHDEALIRDKGLDEIELSIILYFGFRLKD